MHNSDAFDLTDWPAVLVYRAMLDAYLSSGSFPTVLVAMLNLSNWKAVGEPQGQCSLTPAQYRELFTAARLVSLADWHIDWLVFLYSEDLNNGKTRLD